MIWRAILSDVDDDDDDADDDDAAESMLLLLCVCACVCVCVWCELLISRIEKGSFSWRPPRRTQCRNHELAQNCWESSKTQKLAFLEHQTTETEQNNNLDPLQHDPRLTIQSETSNGKRGQSRWEPTKNNSAPVNWVETDPGCMLSFCRMVRLKWKKWVRFLDGPVDCHQKVACTHEYFMTLSTQPKLLRTVTWKRTKQNY